MCNSYLKIKTYCFLVFAAFCILSASPAVTQAYFEDFQGVVGPEWSNDSTDITPAGARTFLGQFSDETVSLTLSSVPAGDVTVSFDLFIILTWDGNGENSCGPDVFDLSVAGGPTLCHTTFATHNHSAESQAYPGVYPVSQNLPNTGATEVDTLGYLRNNNPLLPMDAVYSLSFTFPHAGGPLVLSFSGIGLQGVGDESWGLDNVLVVNRLIDIDIKPGSDPNPINPGSKGLVPVAILSSPEFDATQVDPTTVKLAGACVAVRGKGQSMVHVEDVDEDGLPDLLVQVETQGEDAVWRSGTVQLTGQTYDGQHIVGYDDIIIVPTGKK